MKLIRFILLAVALGASALVSAAADLTLSWKDNSDNETGFAIERKKVGDEAFTEVARVAADVVTWTDAGLPNATAYTYRVRAFNEGGYSAYSGEATGTTVRNPPAAPSDAAVIAVSVVVTITPPAHP